MQTITLQTGQSSDIYSVSPGSRVTMSGSGSIQWTAGSKTDAINNPSWADWPIGSTAGNVDVVRPLCIRAIATGSMTVTIDETPGDKQPDDVYWDSQIASWNATGTALADSATGEPYLRGAPSSGAWMTIPSIFRLRLTGTGTVTIDAKDSLGNITLAVASYTVSGATDQIEFPYAGDNAVAIRATLTGDATCEVI